jgi:hypothetical protein
MSWFGVSTGPGSAIKQASGHGSEQQRFIALMDGLSAFAVTAMLVCYALEQRSTWFILAFAGSCALGSLYGFLQGAWPFALVEAIWALVALRRWHHAGYTRNSRQGYRRAR